MQVLRAAIAPMPALGYAGQPRNMGLSFFSDALTPDTGPPQSGPALLIPPANQPKKPQRWLQRLWLVVFVLFCLEVGIILTVLPWTRLWSDNSLLVGFPALKQFLGYNFVRGLVSGLGLVDIWMGVAEAVTYRERS
jgi:hypothetical protein